MKLKMCPLCGSKRIQKETREVERKIRGKKVAIPAITYWHCLACHEKIFPAPSVRKMEDYLRHLAA